MHLDIFFSDLAVRDWALLFLFCVGYLFITIEHWTHINKTTIALIMAVIAWAFTFGDAKFSYEQKEAFLSTHVNNTSQIVLFLIGALTIVEIINAHQGFSFISRLIRVKSKKQLLWIIGLLAFFLSAVIDNLTTTIIMVAILQKLIQNREQRWLIGGAIVIAANAGGAWSPIGDVTTTMLWIGGHISTLPVMRDLFLPSLACAVIALIWMSFSIKEDHQEPLQELEIPTDPLGLKLLLLGIGCLVAVPFLKVLFGIPPFLGVLLGLGMIWLVTDLAHGQHPDRAHLRVPAALARIDLSSTLFFLGILLSVGTLEIAGILSALAHQLDAWLGNVYLIATSIGIISAIIDNVPLVAASMGMYSLQTYPGDCCFWQLIAFCAGTGGSLLIIGSAAGIAYMGMEKVSFDWFLRKISLPAALGYFGGIGIYFLLN